MSQVKSHPGGSFFEPNHLDTGVNMKNVLLIVVFLFSTTLHAGNTTWEASPWNGAWRVSIGSKERGNYNEVGGITSERKAKRLARKLNRIAKKDKKKGFWDDGSDHCANPLNEC